MQLPSGWREQTGEGAFELGGLASSAPSLENLLTETFSGDNHGNGLVLLGGYWPIDAKSISVVEQQCSGAVVRMNNLKKTAILPEGRLSLFVKGTSTGCQCWIVSSPRVFDSVLDIL